MKLHAMAALTAAQRTEVRRLHTEDRISIRELARRFGVNPTTVQRWTGRDSPLDRSSAPRRTRSSITPSYREAVMTYRQSHPHHGPIRIAHELRSEHPRAHRGTVLKILQAAGLTRPRPARVRTVRPIPVGPHRIQMDLQQLPAFQGGKRSEYKVSCIHLRTRLKYSEIHPEATSVVAAPQRPHQALGGATPMARYLEDYCMHAPSRMLM
jgi:hypothetical protein